jgi:hypothetical protein
MTEAARTVTLLLLESIPKAIYARWLHLQHPIVLTATAASLIKYSALFYSKIDPCFLAEIIH